MEHRTARLTQFRLDPTLGLPMASAAEALTAHRLEPPMDLHSVFLMGSPMAATTVILMVSLMEHRTARLTQFRLDCSTAHDSDPTLGLPMASATEALTAHRLEPPMDPHLVFLMGSPMAATTAVLMVSLMEDWTVRLTHFRLDCSTA